MRTSHCFLDTSSGDSYLSTNIQGSKIESVFNHVNNAFPDARNKIGAVWKKSSNCEGMLISIVGIYDLTYFVELSA
jgi:hypothetical protein